MPRCWPEPSWFDSATASPTRSMKHRQVLHRRRRPRESRVVVDADGLALRSVRVPGFPQSLEPSRGLTGRPLGSPSQVRDRNATVFTARAATWSSNRPPERSAVDGTGTVSGIALPLAKGDSDSSAPASRRDCRGHDRGFRDGRRARCDRLGYDRGLCHRVADDADSSDSCSSQRHVRLLRLRRLHLPRSRR